MSGGTRAYAPATTHDIAFEGGNVVKRFRGRAQAEARREWQALNLLARYAPGLAAEPVCQRLEDSPPLVAMTVVPGRPLGSEPLTAAQLDAVAVALDQLHRAIPDAILRGLEDSGTLPRVVGRIRQLAGAWRSALAWLDSDWVAGAGGRPVFGLGDGNLANLLWDGERVRLVDFEDSGPSHRAQELADLVEHISVWAGAAVEAEAVLGRFDLSPAECHQVAVLRRLFAAFWLMMLLPGGPASHRNPPGTLDRQAARLLELLNAG
jgi:Ser/Thr protein kinase RdoA (MazF antagonist)